MYYKTEGTVYGTLSIDVSNYSTVIVQRVSATATDYGLTIACDNFTAVTYFSSTEHELDISDVTTLQISLKAPAIGYSLTFKEKLVK